MQAVVTNGACHLDARQVLTALDAIDLAATDLLFIENVGNLVCPASWDLGETAKVVLFSVTEGEDKPLKYPKMFRQADATWCSTRSTCCPTSRSTWTARWRYLREVNPGITHLPHVGADRRGAWTTWYDFLRRAASRSVRSRRDRSAARRRAPPVT